MLAETRAALGVHIQRVLYHERVSRRHRLQVLEADLARRTEHRQELLASRRLVDAALQRLSEARQRLADGERQRRRVRRRHALTADDVAFDEGEFQVVVRRLEVGLHQTGETSGPQQQHLPVRRLELGFVEEVDRDLDVIQTLAEAAVSRVQRAEVLVDGRLQRTGVVQQRRIRRLLRVQLVEQSRTLAEV